MKWNLAHKDSLFQGLQDNQICREIIVFHTVTIVDMFVGLLQCRIII